MTNQFFFFNDTATTEIYTLSLHDALPILGLMKEAQASGNPDAMTITVTPGGVTYAVAITSPEVQDREITRLNSRHTAISTASFSLQNFGNISEFLSLGVQDATPSVAWTNT